MELFKNFPYAQAVSLAGQTEILKGQVISKTLVQNSRVSITLFAFDAGEEISTHRSGGDALLSVLEGTGRITIDGEAHTVKAGESILMPANHPHAVYAEEPFKMFLVVVFPKTEK